MSNKEYFKIINYPEKLIWSGKIYKINKYDNR